MDDIYKVVGVKSDDNHSHKKSNDCGLLFNNRIKNEWLSTKEASDYLSVTQNALRIMVHRGKVKAFKFGRRLRFKLDDLESLLIKKEMIYG